MISEKTKDLLRNPHWGYMYIGGYILKWMPDKMYLGLMHRLCFHRKIDWENPKRFTEKLQWLKIFDHNPLYTKLVDKYEVKEYVAGKIGREHVIPTLGVWDCFEDINFDMLPNSFVLKTTHDSGGGIVCEDKNTFDYKAAKRKLKRHLARNFFWKGREWAYKDVKPRIIAEPYIETLGKPNSVEYKLTCFNGRAQNITVCRGIAHDALANRTNDNYNRKLEHLEWWAYYKNGSSEFEFPDVIYDMIQYADILSEGIPQVRVDFYFDEGKVLFGEMTFYTWGGFIHFVPDKTDRLMGDMILLPEKK